MPIIFKQKNEANNKLVRIEQINLATFTNYQNQINSTNWFKGSRERGFR